MLTLGSGGEGAAGIVRVRLREAVRAFRGRGEDPFAAMVEGLRGASGWVEAWVLDCADRGLCPACEAEKAAEEAYLLWLPVNVCDAGFLKGLEETGGLCGKHYAMALEALRRFPRRQARLLGMMERRLERGSPPFARACGLCASLEESRRACLRICEEMARGAGKSPPSSPWSCRVCVAHGVNPR